MTYRELMDAFEELEDFIGGHFENDLPLNLKSLINYINQLSDVNVDYEFVLKVRASILRYNNEKGDRLIEFKIRLINEYPKHIDLCDTVLKNLKIVCMPDSKEEDKEDERVYIIQLTRS